jgi:hypothetical protein
VARKRTGGPLNYRPGRGRYTEKSDAVVLGRVGSAKDLAKQVKSLADDAMADAGVNMQSIDHMVDLFQGKHNLGFPADLRYVNMDSKTAKPADIVFRVLGMLNAPAKYEFIPPLGGDVDDETRDAIEGHLNALDPWFYRKYGSNCDTQSRFWQILAGRAHDQQSYLPAYWDKETRKRQGEEIPQDGDSASAVAARDSLYNARISGFKGYTGPPFFRESIDPRIVVPLRGQMGTCDYVKIYHVKRYEMIESFQQVGLGLQFGRDGSATEVYELNKPAGVSLPRQSDGHELQSPTDYYEYLDDTYCYYVVGDTVAYKYRHDGSMRIFDSFGLQTGFKEMNLMAVGVLWAVRNEVPQYDFLRTLWMQKAYLTVFPQLVAQLQSGDMPLDAEDGSPKEWKIEPGTIKQVRGQLVNALKDAEAGVDFRAALEMYAGDIDMATIPGIARGVAGAQQPGYAINQLSQSMRTLWAPMLDSADLKFSGRAEHYLTSCKEVVGEEVTVFGTTVDETSGRTTGRYYSLKPDVVPDFFRVEGKAEPELPIDTQGNMMTWANLLERGMATEEEFIREGKRKSNPIENSRQMARSAARRAWLPKAVEDAMALGQVHLTNRVIESYGLDKLNSIGAMDVQQLQQAKQAATAAPSPAGGMTPPGSATPPGTPGNGPAVAPGTVTGGEPGPLTTGVTGANPNNATPAFRG